MNHYEQVTKLLPQLSSVELSKVKQQIKALESLSGTSENTLFVPDLKKDESFDTLLLQAITITCEREGLGRLTLAGLQKHYNYKAFKQQAQVLSDFIDRGAPKVRQNRIVLRAFFMLCIDLLIQNLRAIKVPITASVLMVHIQRIPGILDVKFPGYAKAEILSWIVAPYLDQEKQ